MTNWQYKNSFDFEPPTTAFGFVYMIECTLPEDERIRLGITKTKYLGRKYLSASKTTTKRVLNKSGVKVTKKKKSRVESTWRTYMGSCKPLLEDIKRFGAENYRFEILSFSTTKGQVNFLECFFQMRANVLGDDAYYNDAIGSGQFRGVRFDDDFKNMLKEIQV